MISVQQQQVKALPRERYESLNLYCRGYLIERLQTLTGSRFVAAGLPLFVFAICHYEQGWAGITIALLTGAVLTGVYLRKRNLWITFITHFLVDFIPNILLPLFATSSTAK